MPHHEKQEDLTTVTRAREWREMARYKSFRTDSPYCFHYEEGTGA